MAKRILIVEDHHELRSLLVAMLHFMGYETIEAETGEQALEKAVSEDPQLILMDLGLPGMSGIDAARALKQNPTTARIPIIGQSAWDHRLWKKVALEAGMVEYIQKPFRPERLKDAIERFITHNVQHSEHGEKVPWLKRALFLVVVSVIALFTGVYLLRSGLTACRCGRYHYGSGDWLDA